MPPRLYLTWIAFSIVVLVGLRVLASDYPLVKMAAVAVVVGAVASLLAIALADPRRCEK